MDGNPGPGNGVSATLDSGFPVAFAGGVVYKAIEPDGFSLRFSDGTPEGTVVLVTPLSAFDPQEAAGYLYFQGQGDLWRTDGTPEGTAPLSSLGAFDQFPLLLTATSDGTLYIAASDFPNAQLLRLPPGETEPSLVADLGDSDAVETMAAIGDLVVLANEDSTHGAEPWISDGTAEGTKLLANLKPGSDSSFPTQMVSDGTYVWFSAQAFGGRELWRTDGTPEGTLLVVDAEPGVQSSNPGSLTPFQGGLIFRAFQSGSGSEPWFTSPEPGSAYFVDVSPGSTGSAPVGFTVWNDQAFFSGNTPETPPSQDDAFVTDGTPEGTVKIASAAAGFPAATPSFAGLPNGVVFGFTSDAGTELWSSDGTVLGTQLLEDLSPAPLNAGAGLSNFVGYKGSVAFGAELGQDLGSGLYFSDGSAAGTQPVFSSESSGVDIPQPLGVAGDRLVFSGTESAPGGGVWSTDGTQAGALFLASTASGFVVPTIQPGLSFDGRVYFAANDGITGLEPWVSDGTVEGTQPLGDFVEGGGGSDPTSWLVGGDAVYFVAGITPSSGFVSSDVVVCRVPAGASNAEIFIQTLPTSFGKKTNVVEGSDLAFFDEHLFYSTSYEFLGGVFTLLEATNVSGSETVIVDGISKSYGLLVWQDKLVWINSAGALRCVGSPEEAPIDLIGTDLKAVLNGLESVGDRILFWGIEVDKSVSPPTESEPRLYVSDGTPGGAVPVFESPGQGPVFVAGDSVFEPYGAANSVLFRGLTPSEGIELWVSDGTAAGTRPLADVNPGPASSQSEASGPSRALRVENELFFAADDGATGTELHAVPFAQTTGDWAAEPFGVGCAGGSGLVPVIGSSGDAVLGQDFTIEVQSTPPETVALLFGALGQDVVTEFGCTSYLADPVVRLGQLTTDGAGTASLTLGVPAGPSFEGLAAWFQWFVVDPGENRGAFSNALEVVFGG